MSFRNIKSASIPVIFLLLVVVSGCALKDKEAKRQAPEVLIASECGMDKLACCQSEPVCLYSQQCCADPNNATRNYCSDRCSCGAKGEFCCAGDDKCSDGLACVNGNCAECGQDGQACCDETACNDGTVCSNGRCAKCGIEGNVCCAGDDCLDQDKGDATRTECLNGICTQCGAGGRACAGGIKCVPGYLHNSGSCFECGENNQPCCTLDSGKGYVCNPNEFLSCYQGFCLE